MQLRDAIRDTADSDEIKAIVISARHVDFAPPASLTDLLAAADLRSGAMRHKWHAAYCAPSGLYQNLAYCKKVVLTAVHGRCAGAGSMLVLCSDFTVCASDSTFESPFATLPESSLVLAALTMRLNRAKAWMLGGEAWSADQAMQAGLVNRAVDPAQVAGQAQTMAQSAARMPLDGLAMSKILVEAFLDTQGVGQDFDMAGFYDHSMQFPQDSGRKQTAGSAA
jgi:enoyl-CoA hydratase/carnithine racemase